MMVKSISFKMLLGVMGFLLEVIAAVFLYNNVLTVIVLNDLCVSLGCVCAHTNTAVKAGYRKELPVLANFHYKDTEFDTKHLLCQGCNPDKTERKTFQGGGGVQSYFPLLTVLGLSQIAFFFRL